MEFSTRDAIKEQLRKEKLLLEAQVTTLQSQLSSIADELQRVSYAEAVLDGTMSPTKTARCVVPKERKRISNPAAVKADVIKFMTSVLRENDVVDTDTLKDLVEAKIHEAGFTRMGYALRFREALLDTKFVSTPSGIRLSDMAAKMSQRPDSDASISVSYPPVPASAAKGG